MTSNRYLPIYLNDHLAGATGGVELARRIRHSHRGEELGRVMEGLTAEIEADLDSLRDVMRRLDTGTDQLKRLAGFAAEKVGRLKLNGHFLSRSPLSSLIELEALSLGVAGKLALWRSLIALDDQRLAEVDLEDLAERAARQRETIELHRVAVARAVLG